MARTVDTLFVACTRPEMKWGVPWDGFRANFIFTVLIIGIGGLPPPAMLIGVLIHFAMRELCRTNPHFFHKWKIWFRTKAKSLSGDVWGGSRLQPTHTRIRRATDMPIGV
jgi:type IV secretion system protein VirB3